MIKYFFILVIACISLVGCYGPGPYLYHNSTTSSLYVTTNVTATGVDLDPAVWDDLSIALAQAKTPASLAPTWTPYKGSQIPAYSSSAINVIYFSAQLPHSYKEGSSIEFHAHIVYPDNLAGNSVWYATYSWANVDSTFPVATGVYLTVASPTITDYHQLINIVPSISGTGKKISSVLLCSLQRIGNHIEDTYPSELYAVSADFHFKKDTLGSRTEGVK